MAVVTAMACSMVVPAEVQAREPVSIRLQLPWPHQYEFAGFYAAKEFGLYRNMGLDVEIVEGGVGIKPLEECLSGRAQFSIGGSEILLARLRGAPVVALAALFQHSASALMVLDGSDIRQPRDLEGKRIEMGDLATDAESYAMLLGEEVEQEAYTRVPSSFSLDNLLSGKVDAVSVYITNQPFILKRKQISYRFLRPSAYGIDFYGDLLYTTKSMLQERPDVVEDFLAASLDGWQYALLHPEEMADLILASYKPAGPQGSREHLLFEYEQMLQLIQPDIVELGHMNPGRFKHMAEHFQTLNLALNTDRLKGFLYQGRPESQNGAPAWLQPVASIVLALVLAFCVMRVRRCRKRYKRIVAGGKSLARRLKALEENTGIGVLEWFSGEGRLYCDTRSSGMLAECGRDDGELEQSFQCVEVPDELKDLLSIIERRLEVQDIWKGEWTGPNGVLHGTAWKGERFDSSGERPIILMLRIDDTGS